MTTSISKQLKSYFNNIEFIKNGKELSIKPIDVSNNWENFEDNLFQLMETIKIENVKTLIPTFINYRDKQEREFKVLLELKKYLAEKKYDKISVSDAKDYIVKSYSYNTDLKILNWNIAETLNISESFVTEFISLMNFRLHYTRIIVSNLEGMVNTPLITEPQQTFKESENIESTKPNFKNTKKVKEKLDEKNYSYKAIAIAYCMMEEYIIPETALDILKKHSNYRSVGTLLKNRIDKQKSLSKSNENATSNTKHLIALNDAERLLKGMNKLNEVKNLSRIINAFKVNVDNEKED